MQIRRTDGTALAEFERRTALPVMVLALALIPLLVVPMVVDLPAQVESAFTFVDWIIWGLFVVEYLVRLYLTPKRGRFVATHILDLVFIALPVLRPLRVLRVVRAFRGAVVLARAAQSVKSVLTRNKLHYVLMVAVALVFSGALLVEVFERNADGANIRSIPEALWWAITTVTTVGYGDHFPVTAAGRSVAVVLMLMGLIVFGFLAGTLGAYFLDRRDEPDDEPEVDPAMVDLRDRLERIESLLSRLSPDGVSGLPIGAHLDRALAADGFVSGDVGVVSRQRPALGD